MFRKYLLSSLLLGSIFIAAGLNSHSSKNDENTLPQSESSLEVTYIANEGFLISSQNKQVLIDALFGREGIDWCVTPPRDIMKKMENAENPFDNIDLILTTHWHIDHFDPISVSNHLKNNPDGIFISSNQTIEMLKKESDNYENIRGQVIEQTPDLFSSESLSVNGINVKVFRIHHSAYFEVNEETGKRKNRHEDVVNLGFIVDIGGFRIFHAGDENADPDTYKKLRLDRENIDIAFLNRSFLFNIKPETVEIITKYVKPEHIVVMHLYDEQIKYMEQVLDNLPENFPETLYFRSPKDKKVFNK
ncbi:MAG: MBL fold metallo-hydrolase [bacterium]|nr:MBL fold metallo-hydrolase [bacterium]